ncbi:MAG TPA: hypothetical protein VFB41_02810 [Solirubrobacteraceae bacterium]|nr:hypothetical protein [Solirubrobacteraceae bacterium]
MPNRLSTRFVAPLLVVAGATIFGVGAGGIPQVGASLDAATVRTSQPVSDVVDRRVSDVDDRHDGCRDEHPRAQDF